MENWQPASEEILNPFGEELRRSSDNYGLPGKYELKYVHNLNKVRIT